MGELVDELNEFIRWDGVSLLFIKHEPFSFNMPLPLSEEFGVVGETWASCFKHILEIFLGLKNKKNHLLKINLVIMNDDETVCL
jgi:hypothetical protein